MSSLELRVSETLRGRGDCFSPPKEISEWRDLSGSENLRNAINQD